MKESGIYLAIGIIGIFFIGFLLWAVPSYNVWSREMSGRAQLSEAEWSKKIKIEEAKAKKESATYEAQAEIERAKGLKQAQSIISSTLNEKYLKYLWIQTVEKGDNRQTIYIPTEAGLPITEANRLFENSAPSPN